MRMGHSFVAVCIHIVRMYACVYAISPSCRPQIHHHHHHHHHNNNNNNDNGTDPSTHTHPIRDGDDAAAESGEELEPPDDGDDGQPEQNRVEFGGEFPSC
jgi:hypothetical protein